ncbi:MAG TPA: BamA/TamA family outer membrane protein [Gemmatimonadales bacterium]|nr:BamA/TamA family outer membrane protein [Gemmatimonadales bacterium]
MRRIGGIAAALAFFGAAPLVAQYFGQNKVQYSSFDFRIIQTEHFDVYYYPAERTGALDAARMAERWYARLSRILHHQFQGRKPIILYASQSDFQQTNVLDATGEGLGGVTEFLKHRMLLPFTGSYEELEHVIGHEMVHQFQYDEYSRGRIGGGMQTLANVNPPLWFIEGMAEYLSVGPIDPHTSMWLRDASLEGHLPTLQDLTYERVFPYYFGHAMWAYVGEKWGDEAIGQILQASVTGGVEGAFKRTVGVTLDDLVSEWRDAVQTTYLPQLADHYRARRIAQPILTEKRSQGTLHIAPALTPDGREIAYFSEGNSFFVDLYLADAETGKVIRRLVKSTISSNFESLRFINSAGAFSPDGRYFAIAAKHKDRDDLVILDVKKGEEARRIRIPLSGLTTPSWSPDGKQLVFTGYDGGLSDLFMVNADGSNFHRLTNDKYADLQPSWSPDGKTIAFATDRGPVTNFEDLKFGNMRIALYHLDKGTIDILDHMDDGKNIDPVWAPDGRSLAFVSDRSGISNLFLYDFADKNIYQLTNVYTGVSGITPLSPALSWAHEADRLAFAYYEDGEYNVYGVDNPRSLKRQPYRAPAVPLVASLLAAERRAVSGSEPTPAADATTKPAAAEQRAGASIYRSPTGFRSSGTTPQTSDSSAPAPVSVKTLIDSSPALPDTSEFTLKPYHTRFTLDYMARPTIGYERDNFGRGFFGGTAVSLSDMLGNHTLIFSGAVNGRLAEAQVLAAYINQSHRMNWAIGASQEPLYFYLPSLVGPDTTNSGIPGARIFTPQIERFVIRDLFAQSYYPFSRFMRVEFGGHFSNIDQAILSQPYLVDQFGNGAPIGDPVTTDLASVSYYGPQVALVHDNSLFGWVGPFAGSRWRLQLSPTFGAWHFTEGLADWRRYFFARPFTLALRGIFYGRYGRDANLFPQFLGSTELIRGYTSGSLINHECVTEPTATTGASGCPSLDQLIGSKIAVVNLELRFPLTRSLVLGFLPVGLPPIEGAIFYDAGLAWNGTSCDGTPGSCVVLKLNGQDREVYREPLRSWGGSIRMNLLGFVVLRFDYTKPLSRPTYNTPYWTVSLGPTF